jgi:hypothetical protein
VPDENLHNALLGNAVLFRVAAEMAALAWFLVIVFRYFLKPCCQIFY